MDARTAMNQEIVKDALLKHSRTGGILLDDLKKELTDVPGDILETVVENLLFGGQLEETDDGKLLMISFF